jgi:predicted rRNA methylase YqxC with S4 and FtsJ domains
MRLDFAIARTGHAKGDDMAKGMNKRKEVKKPKKEAAKPAVSVASSNAKVTISPGKSKE